MERPRREISVRGTFAEHRILEYYIDGAYPLVGPEFLAVKGNSYIFPLYGAFSGSRGGPPTLGAYKRRLGYRCQ